MPELIAYYDVIVKAVLDVFVTVQLLEYHTSTAGSNMYSTSCSAVPNLMCRNLY